MNITMLKAAGVAYKNAAMGQAHPADTIAQAELRLVQEMEGHLVTNLTARNGGEKSATNSTLIDTYITAVSAAIKA